MSDPYKVLNIPSTATDEEVKKAYRALARKYHPDNYHDNPLADLAQEKMKEINEAYDQIQRERANKSSGSGAGYGYSGTGTGGTSSSSSAGSAATLSRIRALINTGRFSEAGILLDSIPQGARGAEWNYLKGCTLLQRGWYHDAQKLFETACYLDPNNTEYREALMKVIGVSSRFGTGYRTINDSSCSAISTDPPSASANSCR